MKNMTSALVAMAAMAASLNVPSPPRLIFPRTMPQPKRYAASVRQHQRHAAKARNVASHRAAQR